MIENLEELFKNHSGTASFDVEEQKKKVVLLSALRLFSRFGYKKTTVEEIASEAQMGKGTLYLHFSSKHQILLELIHTVVHGFLTEMEESIKQIHSPAEKLKVILFGRPRKANAIFSLSSPGEDLFPLANSDEFKCTMRKPMQKYRDLIYQVLEEGNQQEYWNVQDVAKMADHINFMSFAFLPPYRFTSNIEEINQHIEMYIENLLKSTGFSKGENHE